MHHISELPAWDRLLKRIVWEQIGEIKGKRILDFGSGEGITANHYARENSVVAIEPMEKMLENRWKDYEYVQMIGDETKLLEFSDNSFDLIICHNVREYIEDKEQIINQLYRLLKPGGILSILKHNRAGRVMQMAVLLDDLEKAKDLLNGKDSVSEKFRPIQYYEDEMIVKWNKGLKLVDNLGIRIFWDLQQNQEKHKTEKWQLQMMDLEMKVSKIDAYRQIAFFHHLLFTKD